MRPRTVAERPAPSGLLSGKRALIYGGGTGLGYACAQAMLEAGAAVFVTGRRRERLVEAQARLAALGEVDLVEGDFTVEADVDRITAAADGFLGGIDTLVVSSGRSAIGSIFDCPPATFQEIMTVNLLGPFLAARAAAPHLVRSAPASIIILASVAGTAAMKERVAYCSSKSGVLGLTRSMALDLAEKNVRVNAISPGLILTELAREILSRESDPVAALARRRAQHPLQRLGSPEEIGAAAVYLASDASGWVTGHNLIVDGGLSVA